MSLGAALLIEMPPTTMAFDDKICRPATLNDRRRFRLARANHRLAGANHRLVGANHRLVGANHRLVGANHRLVGTNLDQSRQTWADEDLQAVIFKDAHRPLRPAAFEQKGLSARDKSIRSDC